MSEEKTEVAARPIVRKKRARRREQGEWCVVLVTTNLFVVGPYRELGVELLKQVVPGGARKFYRTVGPEFFGQFPLNSAQAEWLADSKLFNGAWEVLWDYRRTVLEALSLAYPQVWLVENGQSRPHLLPTDQPDQSVEEYKLGGQVVMPLTWARSYSLYCHRHRSWETQPCKDVGLIVEQKRAEAPPVKPTKWPDLELHAPQNTLVRASRKQVSYYLAASGEPVRLGRDAEGEARARQLEDVQRMALVLRAARVITGPPQP